MQAKRTKLQAHKEYSQKVRGFVKLTKFSTGLAQPNLRARKISPGYGNILLIKKDRKMFFFALHGVIL